MIQLPAPPARSPKTIENFHDFLPVHLASLSTIKLNKELSQPRAASLKKLVLVQNLLHEIHYNWAQENALRALEMERESNTTSAYYEEEILVGEIEEDFYDEEECLDIIQDGKVLFNNGDALGTVKTIKSNQLIENLQLEHEKQQHDLKIQMELKQKNQYLEKNSNKTYTNNQNNNLLGDTTNNHDIEEQQQISVLSPTPIILKSNNKLNSTTSFQLPLTPPLSPEKKINEKKTSTNLLPTPKTLASNNNPKKSITTKILAKNNKKSEESKQGRASMGNVFLPPRKESLQMLNVVSNAESNSDTNSAEIIQNAATQNEVTQRKLKHKRSSLSLHSETATDMESFFKETFESFDTLFELDLDLSLK
ncbi:hypothetical protein HK099_005548 [Clydaea vesicula]|uniref:Uncharacterized protein n=1 Tax=Clydaea vesicula TaxID=447962 RepID=A0AAD5U0X6_9FUNG|nr:hypothetical protein HK099_005548 [Clydaea vesicula]KAJ3393495.1 hypothetical protein HDU92_007691 [Lobulomyces angularis]